MKYSPAHIRDITKISQETLRHWRNVLPPLASRKGRNIFSLGDALAFLVIKDLCSSLKIKISEVVPFAHDLFEICNPIKWKSYDKKILVFHTDSKKLEIHDQIVALNSFSGPAVLINIGMHIETVKDFVLGVGEIEQLEMYFGPRLVKKVKG